MKASALIAQLQRVILLVGDLEVAVCDDEYLSYYAVQRVLVEEPDPTNPWQRDPALPPGQRFIVVDGDG